MRVRLPILMLAIGGGAIFAADVLPAPRTPPSDGNPQSRVQVTLVSDGETWVSIPNARVPTKGPAITVSLLPGEYEVVGRRKGYRDVEKTVRVPSGSAPIRLTIICTVSWEDRSP
jgi:hypothetical protein